jgi:proteasome accessory factor C
MSLFMVDTAAIRALRTMDLIPYILENPGVSIKSLSERFSVTEKQIESDLQLVFMCGLPGYTPYELIDIVFEDGIVSVIDPQVLDKPRRFTKSELIVIALGLEILLDISRSNPERNQKLKALSEKITKLGSSNSVTFTHSENSSIFTEVIADAISKRKNIQITYSSLVKDQITDREIAPQRLYFMNGNLYLSAYDLSKKSDRIFKVDLIKKCEITGTANIEVEGEIVDAIRVVLRVNKSHRNFIERNSSIISTVVEKKDFFDVNIDINNIEWLKRSILSNAPGISVVTPTSLANELRQSATSLLALYQAEK